MYQQYVKMACGCLKVRDVILCSYEESSGGSKSNSSTGHASFASSVLLHHRMHSNIGVSLCFVGRSTPQCAGGVVQDIT